MPLRTCYAEEMNSACVCGLTSFSIHPDKPFFMGAAEL